MGNIQTVKKISKEKGISLAFVCRQIGRSHGYLAEIANRDGDVPEKMLGPIANALGVTVEELKGQEPKQKEKPSGLPAGLDATQYTPEQLEVLNAVTEKIQTEEGCQDMYNLLKAMHIL